MKATRFFLHDYAQLEEKDIKNEVYYFFNPFTKKRKDLVLDLNWDWIDIPSRRWRGSFDKFRHEFEHEIKHEFFYPHGKNPSETSLARLEEIILWLQRGFEAQLQLQRNLDSTYRAGFIRDYDASFQLFIGPRHPYYDKDLPQQNLIFEYQIFEQPDLESFINDELEYKRRNLLQVLDEKDLLGIEELRYVYKPKFTLKICEN